MFAAPTHASLSAGLKHLVVYIIYISTYVMIYRLRLITIFIYIYIYIYML